jgi:hypothetical protein
VANPPDETPLYNMANDEGTPVNLDRLIVALSRHLNLCNIFSVRDIDNRVRPVSSFIP